MKRGYYIAFLLILFLTIINASTSQETGVSVTVVSDIPTLELISPQNIAYESDEYILLDYNAVLIDTVWYNLDNGANTTINASFYFQTSIGQHTLYLYGNQSNGTILSDNVTFTVEEAAPSGGGGGRIRKEVIVEEEITVEDKIPVILTQGETKEVKLLIKNERDEETRIRIEDQNLNDLLIRISDIEFYLGPKQTKEVTITFYADKDKIPELYLERAIIKTDYAEKEINFYVEVESLGFLFDVKVDIQEYPRTFVPGEDLVSTIDFYNLGKEGDTEVDIEYLIKDVEGNIIFGEKQILIIGVTISITRTLKLPENIEDGDYVFYIKATYQGKTASASKWFVVKKEISVLERKTKEIISKISKELLKELEEDKEVIAKAILTAIGLYLILNLLEKLFGAKGKYYLIKKRGATKTAKRILKKKRVIRKKSRTLTKRKLRKKKIKKK